MPGRNPSKRESFEGAVLCLENARRLLKASELSAKDSYGPATSLAVFSGEEAVKGNTYLLKWIGLDKHNRKVVHKLLISSHQLRHETSLAVDGVADLVSGNFSNLAENTEAWQTAEEAKQSGFYVDFGDEGWETPNEVTKAEYRTYHEAAERRITGLDQSISWLEELDEQEVELLTNLGDKIANRMREWQNEYDEKDMEDPTAALSDLAQRLLPLLYEWYSKMKEDS